MHLNSMYIHTLVKNFILKSLRCLIHTSRKEFRTATSSYQKSYELAMYTENYALS